MMPALSWRWGSLDGEQQAFYESYISDPMRLIDVTSNELDDTFNLYTAEGASAFEASYRASKQAMAVSYLPQVTDGWTTADKTAFQADLNTAWLDEVPFEPANAAKNTEALSAAAAAWKQARADGAQAAATATREPTT